jgi:hypothetical protein
MVWQLHFLYWQTEGASKSIRYSEDNCQCCDKTQQRFGIGTLFEVLAYILARFLRDIAKDV